MTEKLTFDRMYRATLAEVWALWTTKDGLESWFCPDGFAITVHAIDLRTGGSIDLETRAVRDQEVEYMISVGMPLTNTMRLTYDEVVPQTKLRYVTRVDHVDGIDMVTEVTMTETPQGIHMVLITDAMPDPEWTPQFIEGWEEQLAKFGAKLAAA